MTRPVSRRGFLLASAGAAAGLALHPQTAGAQPARAAQASPANAASMQEAIRKVVGSARINKGKVVLDLPPLVDNGNTVSLGVRVDSPMTEQDHVRAIHIFNEKNPQPDVASFRLGPRAGRASVATRIRLADTQTVVAVCELSDGSFWSGSAEAVVTIAACLEDL